MSRKKKAKAKSGSISSFFQPSLSWLPAFFIGLSIGILIHLIPGMDIILGEARKAQRQEETASADRPIMWRPQVSNSR